MSNKRIKTFIRNCDFNALEQCILDGISIYDIGNLAIEDLVNNNNFRVFDFLFEKSLDLNNKVYEGKTLFHILVQYLANSTKKKQIINLDNPRHAERMGNRIGSVRINRERFSYLVDRYLVELNFHTNELINSTFVDNTIQMKLYNNLILHENSSGFSILDRGTQKEILQVNTRSWLKEVSKNEALIAYVDSKYLFEKSLLYIRNINSKEIVAEIDIDANFGVSETLFLSDSLFVYTVSKHTYTKMFLYNIDTKSTKLLHTYNNLYPHNLTYLEKSSLLFVGLSSHTKKCDKYMLIDLNGNIILENSCIEVVDNYTIINDYLVTLNHEKKEISIIDIFSNSTIDRITNIQFTKFYNASPLLDGSTLAPHTTEFRVFFDNDYIVVRDDENNVKLINCFYFKQYIDFFLKNHANFFIVDNRNKSVYSYSNTLMQHYYSIEHLTETNNIDVLRTFLNHRIMEIDSKSIFLLLKKDLNSILNDLLLKIIKNEVIYKKTGEALRVLSLGLENYSLPIVKISIDSDVYYKGLIKNKEFLSLIKKERIDILELFLEDKYYKDEIYKQSLFILSKCIEYNSFNVIKFLIDGHYVKISSKPYEGNTLIHLVTQQNSYNIMKLLIPFFKKNDLEIKNIDNESAMDIACKYKYNDIIQLLSSNGIKIPLLYKLLNLTWK